MKITFEPFDETTECVMEAPSPSSKHLPEWYKKMNTYMRASKPPHPKAYNWETGKDLSNLSMKSCVPVFDALTSGYMLTLSADVIVTHDSNYKFRMMWDVPWQIVTTHNKSQYSTLNVPNEYEEDAYKWENTWVVNTPKGYSCIFTHPANRFDLPFFTLTGHVDTDTYNIPVNLPFFLRKDFEGIIKKGTPIAQVIPYRRETWKSEVVKHDPRSVHRLHKLKTTIIRSYKENYWFRKFFN